MEPQTEVVKRKPFLTRMDYDKFESNGRDLNATSHCFSLKSVNTLTISGRRNTILRASQEYGPVQRGPFLGILIQVEMPFFLDDAFTGPDCPLEMFSQSTFEILAYFYNFHMD